MECLADVLQRQPRLGDIPVMVFPGDAESDVSALLEDEKTVSFLP